jgi:hypothetical protein
MLNILVEPPHIKQAKAALVEAGIPLEGVMAALNLAARFYQETTQQSRTDALWHERNQTQQELECVSENLLLERKKSAQLTCQLATVRQSTVAALGQAKSLIRILRRRMREMHHILTHPTMTSVRKLEKLRFEVETVLASEAVTTSVNAPASNESLAPIVLAPTKPSPTNKRQKRPAVSPLEITQRGRIAELEALLSRRSHYEKVGDKLLSRLAEIIGQPELPLIKAAGDNPLLQDLLKRWQSLCGTVQFLRENGGEPAPIATCAFSTIEKDL